MDDGLDSSLLRLARGTPLSLALEGMDPPAGGDGWGALGQGWYVVTSEIFGADGDPGVLGFAWVRWDAVVDLVLRHTVLPDACHRKNEHLEPAARLLGFTPLRFAAAVGHEKAQGHRPMHTAVYRFPEGRFSHSEVSTSSRTYYFEAPNPDTRDDRAIGVLLKLG